MANEAYDFSDLSAIDGMDDATEEVRAERIRRMKALVRKLHKEELEPAKKLIPEIHRKGLIALVSLLAVVLFSVTSMYNYNQFIVLREQVMSNKGHVEAALQRRANLFGNLVNLALNHAALEERIFNHVADVRTDIDSTNKSLKTFLENYDGSAASASGEGSSAKALDPRLASSIESSMARLLAVVEQYPDIQSSTTYQQLMDKLVEIENRIAGRRAEYNESAMVYNKTTSSFPWFILAKATGFGRYAYYKAKESMNVAPILSSDTFKRLLPGQKKTR